MAYQMAATVVTLNVLQGHSEVACLFKCNPSNIYAAFYTNSTDTRPIYCVLLFPATDKNKFD